jgi:ribosomal protein L30/L7E
MIAAALAARSPIALAASPVRVHLTGTSTRTVRITNWGASEVVADVGTAGFALGLRGRPRIVRRGSGSSLAASWIAVRPRRFALAPGRTETLTVSSSLPRGAEPGDHPALVLVGTRPRERGGVAVRMRIGIVVVVRVPGTIVHRLAVRGLRLRRVSQMDVLELSISNRGNVTERMGPSRLRIVLLQRGRIVGRPRAARRELLPRSRAIEEIRLRGRLAGPVTVLVELGQGARMIGRRFHLRV